MRKYPNPYRITSIADQHQLLQLPKPKHPLISITNLENTKELPRHIAARFSLGFYAIAIARHFTCTMQYGQEKFDFRKGLLSFVAPNQLLSWASNTSERSLGWLVSIHPDFLRENMPGLKLEEFSFFSYAGNEALQLSQQEESMLMALIDNIKKEYSSIEDPSSQRIVTSYIWLLLQYADRAYRRQSFATNNPLVGLIAKIDTILSAYINGNLIVEKGLPTVQYLSNRLNFSPNYLNER